MNKKIILIIAIIGVVTIAGLSVAATTKTKNNDIDSVNTVSKEGSEEVNEDTDSVTKTKVNDFETIITVPDYKKQYSEEDLEEMFEDMYEDMSEEEIDEQIKKNNEEQVKKEEEIKETIKKCKISEDMAVKKAMEALNKEYNLNLTKKNQEGTMPVKEIVEKIDGETNKFKAVLSWYVYFEKGDDFYNCCINAVTGEVVKMMFCKPDGTFEVPERFKHTLDFPRVSVS